RGPRALERRAREHTRAETRPRPRSDRLYPHPHVALAGRQCRRDRIIDIEEIVTVRSIERLRGDELAVDQDIEAFVALLAPIGAAQRHRACADARIELEEPAIARIASAVAAIARRIRIGRAQSMPLLIGVIAKPDDVERGCIERTLALARRRLLGLGRLPLALG